MISTVELRRFNSRSVGSKKVLNRFEHSHSSQARAILAFALSIVLRRERRRKWAAKI